MKKETYLRKLAETEITDENTVGEAKKAKALKKTLAKFWEDAALAHIKKTEGVDLKAELASWTNLKFQYTFKAGGKIKVEQYAAGDHVADTLRRTFTVDKRDLFTTQPTRKAAARPAGKRKKVNKVRPMTPETLTDFSTSIVTLGDVQALKVSNNIYEADLYLVADPGADTYFDPILTVVTEDIAQEYRNGENQGSVEGEQLDLVYGQMRYAGALVTEVLTRTPLDLTDREDLNLDSPRREWEDDGVSLDWFGADGYPRYYHIVPALLKSEDPEVQAFLKEHLKEIQGPAVFNEISVKPARVVTTPAGEARMYSLKYPKAAEALYEYMKNHKTWISGTKNWMDKIHLEDDQVVMGEQGLYRSERPEVLASRKKGFLILSETGYFQVTEEQNPEKWHAELTTPSQYKTTN